jgi:beta-phosphoglucomutase
MPMGFIFDLDGVIVDTAHFHYRAWKQIASQLGFELTLEHNESLKGVSRVASLQKIAEWAQVSLSQAESERLMHQKNEEYLGYVSQMSSQDILPGVKDFFEQLPSLGIKTALGSASKNATTILQKVGMLDCFDAIVDGTAVTLAKPDPAVFLLAAERIQASPQDCVVFEDSMAGIEAAYRAGMYSVGVGDASQLKGANRVIPGFLEVSAQEILEAMENYKK